MTSHPPTPDGFSRDLEQAHQNAVRAVVAGLSDPGLGPVRLAGPAVQDLAEAAVSSATPFLRAPALARVSRALVLHPPAGDSAGNCPTCSTPAPCETARVLRG